MAKKSWGAAGAWAADAELAESSSSEEVAMAAPPPPPPPPLPSSSSSSAIMDDSAFPSLVEAASTKVSKKKKAQPVPLAKFVAAKPASLSESKGLTYEDMVMLPTGPRDRSGEELPAGGLGGGFRDYGGYRGGGGDRDRDGGGRRSSDREGGGGFGRESGFGRDSAADEPSRADNAEDWGASKKFVPSGGGGGGGGGGGRYDDDSSHGRRRMNDFPSSKADEDSHWGSSKKFLPPSSSSSSSSDHRRSSSKYDFSARNGTDSSSSAYPKSAVDEVENWASAKRSSSSSPSMAPSYYDSFSSSGRDKDFGLPRDRDGADADKWVKSRDRDASRPLSSSGDRERERPRLVLQPRTQQPSSDTAVAAVGKEEPAPPEDTQPGSDDTTIAVQKPARKINPFGEAKPREVVLEEKGVNWKKHLDADADDLKSVDRTSEELKLKEEIKRIEDAIKEKEGERKGKENDDEDEDEDAEKAIAELKAELRQAQEKLENFTLSGAEKKENGGANDVWSRNSSNGRHSVMPQERRGGRW